MKKYRLLYVYAFIKSDGENGVYEDLCSDATIVEGIQHAKELWPYADEFRASNFYLPDPYSYLFAENGYKSMLQRIAFADEAPSEANFNATKAYLNRLNGLQ